MLVCGVACSAGAPKTRSVHSMPVTVVDGDGDTVRLATLATRVVSLVPSATDLIGALGQPSPLVGRTRYDTAKAIQTVASVGGTEDPDLERLFALQPDLIIAWQGAKRAPIRRTIASHGIAVYAADTRDSAALYRTVHDLGALLGRDSTAAALASTLRAQIDSVHASVAGLGTPSVLFVIWGDPPMTVGPHTFIAELIRIAGGRDAFDDATTDWPRVSMEQIVHRAPDVVVLSVGEDSARGAELLRHSPGWRTLPAVRTGHVAEVPADLTIRPGPLFGVAARTFRDAIHPEARHQ